MFLMIVCVTIFKKVPVIYLLSQKIQLLIPDVHGLCCWSVLKNGSREMGEEEEKDEIKQRETLEPAAGDPMLIQLQENSLIRTVLP